MGMIYSATLLQSSIAAGSQFCVQAYCDFACRDWASEMFKMSVGPQWGRGRREETHRHEEGGRKARAGRVESNTDAYLAMC